MRTLPGTRDARFESEMATLASLRVMARVPTGAAPSGPARSIRAGATNQHHRITRGKSVVARSSVDVEETKAEGGAFDDALADVRNSSLGFVFQQFHLLGHASAMENVMLPMIYAGVPKDERIERAQAALSRVGLAQRLENKPNQLSGGQQQRVAIARAIINRPSLLLADEPTGALDSSTTAEVLELFDELHQQGITLVMVTHEDNVAARAQRIAQFQDGRVLK